MVDFGGNKIVETGRTQRAAGTYLTQSML